ncbi:MAG: methyltransferase domain-containing protein [Chloroflexota bacterium]
MDHSRARDRADLAIDHDALYRHRFGPEESAGRAALWHEIGRHLQRYIPLDSVVLDLGAGSGNFIANIKARERWASDLRDTSAEMPADIKFVCSDGLTLRGAVPMGHFDRIFMSNYLEHLPSPKAVVEQLAVVRDLLIVGGQVIILQPNIRLTGGHYWDFIDHHTPLTERSLAEAALTAGLEPTKTIVRFLPYTTKSRLPQAAWLVRAYLAFPPIWRLMGKQTLFIAERST